MRHECVVHTCTMPKLPNLISEIPKRTCLGWESVSFGRHWLIPRLPPKQVKGMLFAYGGLYHHTSLHKSLQASVLNAVFVVSLTILSVAPRFVSRTSAFRISICKACKRAFITNIIKVAIILSKNADLTLEASVLPKGRVETAKQLFFWPRPVTLCKRWFRAVVSLDHLIISGRRILVARIPAVSATSS